MPLAEVIKSLERVLSLASATKLPRGWRVYSCNCGGAVGNSKHKKRLLVRAQQREKVVIVNRRQIFEHHGGQLFAMSDGMSGAKIVLPVRPVDGVGTDA
jgi:hypothetical protein